MTFEELVNNEREDQDIIWGEQNHNPYKWLAILGEEVGELNKSALEAHFSNPESVPHPGFQMELIQVAAVCKAIWESGKRNSWL